MNENPSSDKKTPAAATPEHASATPAEITPQPVAPAESIAPANAVAPAEAVGPADPAAGTGLGAAPSQQEMAVRIALEAVLDPEIGLSVIDLGLIREIHIHPDRTHVRMMLTTPFCPYAPQMMEDVKQATMGVIPLPCDVEIMPDAWNPQMMPDPGLLGFSF